MPDNKKPGFEILSKAQQKSLKEGENQEGIVLKEDKAIKYTPVSLRNGDTSTSNQQEEIPLPSIFNQIDRAKKLTDEEKAEIAKTILSPPKISDILERFYANYPTSLNGKRSTIVDIGNYTPGVSEVVANILGTNATSEANGKIRDFFRDRTGKYWYKTSKNEPLFLNGELNKSDNNPYFDIIIKNEATIKISTGDFYLEKTPMRLVPSKTIFADSQGRLDVNRWNAFLNGGTYSNYTYTPLIELGVEFEDHVTSLNRPYTIKESKIVDVGAGVNTVEINPEYNFLIDSFETVSSYPYVEEHIMPNLYALTSQLVEGNEYTNGDKVSLKLNTLFGKLSKVLATVTNNGRNEIIDFDQYFDAWAENVLKVTQSEKQELRRRFKYQIFTQEDLELLRKKDFYKRSLLTPWCVYINFATDVTTEIAEILQDTKYSKKFISSIVKNEVASAEFGENLGLFKEKEFNLFNEMIQITDIGTGPPIAKKIIEHEISSLKMFDLYEWWDNLETEVSSLKQAAAKIEPVEIIQNIADEGIEGFFERQERDIIDFIGKSEQEESNNVQNNSIGKSNFVGKVTNFDSYKTSEIKVVDYAKIGTQNNSNRLGGQQQESGPSFLERDIKDYGVAFNIEPIASSTNSVLESLRKVIFAGKLNKIVKKYFRTHKKFLRGEQCYSETILYKISKYRVYDGVTETVPIQVTYLPNSNEIDYIQFIDNQVKYDKDYEYDIVAYQAVIGTVYEYKNIVGEQSQILINSDGSADVLVISRPSVKIIEMPYHIDTIRRIVDSPPIPPEVAFMPIKDAKNEFYIRLTDGVGQRVENPVAILLEDQDKIDKMLKAQKDELEDGKVVYDEDDIIKTYQIFRMTTKPKVIEDFSENLYAILHTNILLNEFRYLSNIAFKEKVQPNVKYYYMVRSLDYHNNMSNPSFVYEVENVLDSGATYLKVNVIYFDEEKNKSKTKNVKRFIKIAPSFIQKEINLDRIDLENLNKVNKNVLLGDADNSVWEREIKIRLNSRSSGKKIDFNIVMSHGIKEKKFKGIDGKNKSIPDSRRGEKTVLEYANLMEEDKKK